MERRSQAEGRRGEGVGGEEGVEGRSGEEKQRRG
jgi:hypothetical protein